MQNVDVIQMTPPRLDQQICNSLVTVDIPVSYGNTYGNTYT